MYHWCRWLQRVNISLSTLVNVPGSGTVMTMSSPVLRAFSVSPWRVRDTRSKPHVLCRSKMPLEDSSEDLNSPRCYRVPVLVSLSKTGQSSQYFIVLTSGSTILFVGFLSNSSESSFAKIWWTRLKNARSGNVWRIFSPRFSFVLAKTPPKPLSTQTLQILTWLSAKIT